MAQALIPSCDTSVLFFPTHNASVNRHTRLTEPLNVGLISLCVCMHISWTLGLASPPTTVCHIGSVALISILDVSLQILVLKCRFQALLLPRMILLISNFVMLMTHSNAAAAFLTTVIQVVGLLIMRTADMRQRSQVRNKVSCKEETQISSGAKSESEDSWCVKSSKIVMRKSTLDSLSIINGSKSCEPLASSIHDAVSLSCNKDKSEQGCLELEKLRGTKEHETGCFMDELGDVESDSFGDSRNPSKASMTHIFMSQGADEAFGSQRSLPSYIKSASIGRASADIHHSVFPGSEEDNMAAAAALKIQAACISSVAMRQKGVGSVKQLDPSLQASLLAIKTSMSACDHVKVSVVLPWSNPEDVPVGALDNVKSQLMKKHPQLYVSGAILRKGSLILSLDISCPGYDDPQDMAINCLSQVSVEEWVAWLQAPAPQDGQLIHVQIGQDRLRLLWSAASNSWVHASSSKEIEALESSQNAQGARPCLSVFDVAVVASGAKACVDVCLPTGWELPVKQPAAFTDGVTTLMAHCAGHKVPLAWSFKPSTDSSVAMWELELDLSEASAALPAVVVLEMWSGHHLLTWSELLAVPAAMAAVVHELRSVEDCGETGTSRLETALAHGRWLEFVATLQSENVVSRQAVGSSSARKHCTAMEAVGISLLSSSLTRGWTATPKLLLHGLMDAFGLSFPRVCEKVEAANANSMLHLAIISMALPTVQMLVQLGDDLGYPFTWREENPVGATPLHLLACMGPSSTNLLRHLFCLIPSASDAWHRAEGSLHVTPHQVARQRLASSATTPVAAAAVSAAPDTSAAQQMPRSTAPSSSDHAHGSMTSRDGSHVLKQQTLEEFSRYIRAEYLPLNKIYSCCISLSIGCFVTYRFASSFDAVKLLASYMLFLANIAVIFAPATPERVVRVADLALEFVKTSAVPFWVAELPAVLRIFIFSAEITGCRQLRPLLQSVHTKVHVYPRPYAAAAPFSPEYAQEDACSTQPLCCSYVPYSRVCSRRCIFNPTLMLQLRPLLQSMLTKMHVQPPPFAAAACLTPGYTHEDACSTPPLGCSYVPYSRVCSGRCMFNPHLSLQLRSLLQSILTKMRHAILCCSYVPENAHKDACSTPP